MRVDRFGAATFGVLLVGLGPLAADDLNWRRYTNARYGASAEVPMGLFTAGRAPDNGDGQSLRSSDGAATVLIYGSLYSSSSDNFAAYRETTLGDERRDGLDITYKTAGHDFFVYSGVKGGMIVYTKTIVGCPDIAETLQITYPATQKVLYDSIVSRMARSLSVRPSAECR